MAASSGEYACDTCDKTFASKKRLDQHNRDKHAHASQPSGQAGGNAEALVTDLLRTALALQDAWEAKEKETKVQEKEAARKIRQKQLRSDAAIAKDRTALEAEKAQLAAERRRFYEDTQREKARIIEKARQQASLIESKAAKIKEKAIAERDAWAAEKAMIAQTQVVPHNRVKLSIGGTIFETSKATLTEGPAEDSFFGAFLSGRHNLHQGDDGSIFVDRDATYFSYILRYLREPTMWRPPADKDTRLCIAEEAKFYQIGGNIRDTLRYMQRESGRDQTRSNTQYVGTNSIRGMLYKVTATDPAATMTLAKVDASSSYGNNIQHVWVDYGGNKVEGKMEKGGGRWSFEEDVWPVKEFTLIFDCQQNPYHMVCSCTFYDELWDSDSEDDSEDESEYESE